MVLTEVSCFSSKTSYREGDTVSTEEVKASSNVFCLILT